ncbi:DUF2254 domain-containing protein [Winogradskyella sp. J14-2]|uniref:DUF2254 domain-containing protein n=1 Tax=Winogradskyella sp. J14-2 TaxID=1936080 RepID=UPI001E4742E8|nr:DUF2254 domain-containing protein [Winogradskyella sp. J14-2]
MAILFIYIDREYPLKPEGILNLIFSENPESGRNVLSLISGSMAGIAGTVFSITLVVLQLATSQLGPRLLKNFMYQRINQVVLGQYLGLYMYCIIVINAIRDGSEFSFIPNQSILVAIIFTIMNVFLLILYIHSVSTNIQPSKVIDRLGKNLKLKSDQLYPDLNSGIEESFTKTFNEGLYYTQSIKTLKHGYIQYFDLEALVKFSEANNCIIKILEKPGAYTIKHQAVLEVLSKTEMLLSQDKIETLNSCYEVFRSKSLFQDTEFAILQIVEIASRALSPGINDPYTAINCIDQLTASLSVLANADVPQRFVTNNPDELRLIVPRTDFKGFLETAFNDILQFGANTPAIIYRLMASIDKLIKSDDSKLHHTVLKEYARRILQTAEHHFKLKQDLNKLQVMYKNLNFYI